jgi:2-desacetyl-2-hydroxyethyl bacteriochlorophyllide A dehydrogenase
MTMRHTLYFSRPYHVDVREEPLPALAPHQLLVQTHLSAVSAGTEMLFYRGQIPAEMAADAAFAGMGERVQYPIAYGYCSVGQVNACGAQVDSSWLGRRVFAFQPHTSHFTCEPAALLPIPDGICDEQAVLLPNMETAVNFAMDAGPLVGERVLVFGLGIVGILTTRLLSHYPLAQLVAIDGYAKRRATMESWGIATCPAADAITELSNFDPDLILEVSSNPAALATAIELAKFGTRIIVGSWYGDKPATLPLGGPFHRNRVQVISSQVSTVDGRFSNRWDKARRIATAWHFLRDLPAERLISHRVPLIEGRLAYELLDQRPAETIQLVFTYADSHSTT